MRTAFRVVIVVFALAACARTLPAAQLTVELGAAPGVKSVAAIQRWDADGNPRREPDPKAKIESPAVDATAKSAGQGRWVFSNLPAGKYDLLIFAAERVRIEGFTFPPVLEFDPFFTAADEVAEEAREFITEDIAKARHYENKVQPLAMGGDDKTVRVLVMLLRDLPTSYESEMPGAATMRFEIWQYDWKYGGWVKNKRTRVLHRVILPRDQLRQWTWVWDPKLGGIEVASKPLTIQYQLPPAGRGLKGLLPSPASGEG